MDVWRRGVGWVYPGIACGLVGCGYLGWGAAREFREMRAQLRVLRGRVERAAGPGEPVFVDTYGLALALYVAGSPELRQQLVYAGTGVEPDSLLGRGEEAVVTTAHAEALERSLRSKGWVVRPPMGDRNGETFAGQNVRVFFVVRPEVGR